MNTETRALFIEALLAKPPELIASVWIIDRIPVLFDGNLEAYATWRAKLALRLNVDPSALVITGSSAFGISLNPYKNYRIFDGDSDIDVAVISEYHFGQAWHALRNLGSTIFKLSPAAYQSVQDHVKRLIYWGTIATDQILHIFPFADEWQKALDDQAKVSPTVGRKINARIYRDHASLRDYQVNNLRNLRSAELEKGVSNV